MIQTVAAPMKVAMARRAMMRKQQRHQDCTSFPPHTITLSKCSLCAQCINTMYSCANFTPANRNSSKINGNSNSQSSCINAGRSGGCGVGGGSVPCTGHLRRTKLGG